MLRKTTKTLIMNPTFYKNISLLILRIVFGGLMLLHGFPKFMKLVNGDTSFSDPFGIGSFPSLLLTIFAEFICAVLVMIGFKTRWTVIPLIITMITAAFVIHGGDPLKEKEMALLYLGGYLPLLFLGGGKFSVDKLF